MRIHELRCEQRFPLGIAETFEFFEDPGNLALITPRWLGFEIRTPDVEMRAGAQIDYTIRWLGLSMPWRSLIEQYDPPVAFVDKQIRGPYALWEHLHRFLPDGDGTLVTDIVRYALPFGALGSLAHSILVQRQLREIFRYRQRTLAEILGSKTI
jgi:hypothetical protein